jgi:hypothetical protein
MCVQRRLLFLNLLLLRLLAQTESVPVTTLNLNYRSLSRSNSSREARDTD